jgi:ADP-ribosylglycohydrolase
MRITEDHIKSILFGVAVGDALGVPVEFSSRERMEKNPLSEMIGYGTYNQPKGTWSDDSTMTFCLAETLLDSEFSLRKLANRFINWVDWGYWTPHGELFDIGNSTHSAIERLRTIDNPELAGGSDETENGNGSLMRILPLILETGKLAISDSYELVNSVSSLTHKHIRSIISCFYYLTFARHLIHGHSKESTYEMTNKIVLNELHKREISEIELKHFERIFNDIIPSLNYNEIRGSGYVLHSLESSIWCLLKTENYKDSVLKAINLGEDTDTTAAITGGLAALTYGFKSIPKEWVDQIVKNEEIMDLANRLSEKYIKKFRLEDIPEIGDMYGANKFAHKFSGYRTTVEETAKYSRETRNKIENNQIDEVSSSEIAESLFFHFRAVRHGGREPNQKLVNKHLELLKLKLTGK